jgi:hypothetical protein
LLIAPSLGCGMTVHKSLSRLLSLPKTPLREDRAGTEDKGCNRLSQVAQ